MTSSSRISPTAHYTSYIWYRNGLSNPALATFWGRSLFWALEPFNALTRLTRGGLSLDRMLVRRHRVIDHLIDRAIESAAIGQVLEVGCGLSPRAARLVARHTGKNLLYVECDLPRIAERKRRLLRRVGPMSRRHRVVDLDALADDGPLCLEAVASKHLRAGVRTAIVTEGLVNYFPPAALRAMWTRFAQQLRSLGGGIYLSDIHLQTDTPRTCVTRAFKLGLEIFVRGATHLHFADERIAHTSLISAGFDSAHLISPRDREAEIDLPAMRHPDLVRIIAATVGEPPVADG